MRPIYLSVILWLICPYLFGQSIFNILDFGAKGDSSFINTKAIQAAIDQCSLSGGGRVIVPSGTFMSGTIFLKNNVDLCLNQPTSVLKGSGEINHYENKAFIFAKNQSNISISGRGMIDGNGKHKNFFSEDAYGGIRGRPITIRFEECKNVKMKEFRMQNGAAHCINLVKCMYITVDDINISSRVVANNDGLDIIDCHYTTVSNSYFDCGDDAICPKSDSTFGVEDLTITNCIVKSESNGIKFGTSSIGGFRNIAISNCVIRDTRLSGIALEMVDGGIMDRIVINNITMNKVDGAIFIKLGQRKGNSPGVLRNIIISNIIADSIGSWKPDTKSDYFKNDKDPRIGMSISGQPGYLVENITLSNIYMQFAGGGKLEDAKLTMRDTPELYPEFTNFGVTPAYGFNCRHVKNIIFDNVQFKLINPDDRPVLFFEDAYNISINKLQAEISTKATSFIRLRDVDNAMVQACKPNGPQTPFLLLEGKITDISIINNDLRKVNKTYVSESSIKKDEVFEN